MSFQPSMHLGFTPSTREPGQFGSPPLPEPGQRRHRGGLRRWVAARLFRI